MTKRSQPKRPGPTIPPERVAVARACLARFMSGPATEAELASLFGISTRRARCIVAAARDELRAEASTDRETKRAEVRSGIVECVAKAMAKNQLRTALGGLQLLVALDGLAAPSQVSIEHTGLMDGAILGERALLARYAELRARRDERETVEESTDTDDDGADKPN